RRRSGCEKGAARPLHRSMCHPAPAGAPATVSDPERFTSEPDRTRPLGMAARPRHKRSMQAYHELLARILDEGVEQQDRTGTGTLSVFGHQMRFDLSKGFPLLTTKKLHIRSILIELLWFLRGDTNIAWLKENRVSIWDEWADENGDLG